MRVIIAGGRDFTDKSLLYSKCDLILANQQNIEIVSGGAKGADTLGEQYATDRGYPLTRYNADWDKYKKAAGPIRNKLMNENADALIAFFNLKSKGTRNMIEEASKRNLKVRIIKY